MSLFRVTGVDEATQLPMAARAEEEVEGKATQSPRSYQLRKFGKKSASFYANPFIF